MFGRIGEHEFPLYVLGLSYKDWAERRFDDKNLFIYETSSKQESVNNSFWWLTMRQAVLILYETLRLKTVIEYKFYWICSHCKKIQEGIKKMEIHASLKWQITTLQPH